jgi:hypothetical protein
VSVAASPRALAEPTSDGALARETALVDQARSALSARDLASAEHALRAYRASRRVGVLDREALILEVELSLAQGQLTRARALAARFRQAYPGDAHLPRLNASLDEHANPK